MSDGGGRDTQFIGSLGERTGSGEDLESAQSTECGKLSIWQTGPPD